MSQSSGLVHQRILDCKGNDHSGKHLDIPDRARHDFRVFCEQRHIER